MSSIVSEMRKYVYRDVSWPFQSDGWGPEDRVVSVINSVFVVVSTFMPSAKDMRMEDYWEAL